jgi:hypothetical protein
VIFVRNHLQIDCISRNIWVHADKIIHIVIWRYEENKNVKLVFWIMMICHGKYYFHHTVCLFLCSVSFL